MKNNPISKLIRLKMIIPVLLLLFSSCRQEEPYSVPSTDSTPVTLSVSISNNLTSASGDAASAIKNLCILQFYADNGGGFGTLRHAGMCTNDGTGTKYQTRLLRSNYGEAYKLVVVANLPRHGFVYYQNLIGKSYTEIQQALLSEISGTRLDFTAGTPFPMFGIPGDGTGQIIGETLNLSTVSLVRAVARVDIGIGKKNVDANTWNKNGVKFNMTGVQIWKAGKQYAYMPEIDAFTSSGGVLTITKPSPSPDGGVTESISYTGSDITDATYCSEKIYVPEAFLEWGSVYDSKHTQRVAIIVKGRYGNSQNETYYRVDFTNDQTGEKMDILRNHVYQFTIKRVADDGYDTAEEAYVGKPHGLSFTTSIELWQTGVENAKPLPQEGLLMSYGAQNGNVTNGDGITIIKKSTGWTGENADPLVTVDYNNFYGEVQGNLKRSVAYPNGDIYPDLPTLAGVEGVYPSLIVSTDDVYAVSGSSDVHWKDGLVFTAFDLCRSYSGLGYSDWRLPRASELALMYLNRKSLEKQRGFTAFSGTYWSGSEKGNPTDPVAAEAWVVNFDNAPRFLGANKVSSNCKVRCVRQVSN